jgi:hypothetical protein
VTLPAFSGCNRPAPPEAATRSRRPTVAERFGGNKNTNLIASPKTVTAWRTVGSFGLITSGADMANRFKKVGSGVTVPSNLAVQLAGILLDDRSYESPDVADSCIHVPDLVVTFSDAKKQLDAFFCLDCHVMIVEPGDRDYLFKQGVPQRVIGIMKQIFPSDAAIQALQGN